MVEHAFQEAQQILADQVHFYLSCEKWTHSAPKFDFAPSPVNDLHLYLLMKDVRAIFGVK